MDRQLTQKEIRTRRLRRFIRMAVPVLVAGAAAAWIVSGSATRSVSASSLTFSTAATGPLETSVSASGTVNAAFEEVINSPIQSRVLEVCHRPGDIVEAGTPLVILDLEATRLDAEREADRLRMKQLELEQMRVADNTALSDIGMQIKVGQMRVLRLRAELANERYLDSIGSGTTDNVREAEFALRSAELELEQQQLRLADEKAARKAARDVKQLEIDVMKKEAALAARTLGDAGIRSPRRGTVTHIHDKIGSQVSQGQQLAVVADLGHFEIEAEVAHASSKSVRPGCPVVARVGSAELEGRVTSVSPTSDRGVVAFMVALDNDSAAVLRPGVRADVFVKGSTRDNVVRIANGAYYTGPGTYSLYVRNGNNLVLRNVVLGDASMEHVAVESGINPGEEVVLTDMARFRNARRLRLKNK